MGSRTLLWRYRCPEAFLQGRRPMTHPHRIIGIVIAAWLGSSCLAPLSFAAQGEKPARCLAELASDRCFPNRRTMIKFPRQHLAVECGNWSWCQSGNSNGGTGVGSGTDGGTGVGSGTDGGTGGGGLSCTERCDERSKSCRIECLKDTCRSKCMDDGQRCKDYCRQGGN